MNTLEQRILKCIAEVLGIDTAAIAPAHHLERDLGTDSLDKLEIAMALESEFRCQIDDEQAQRLITVQNVIDHLRALHDPALDSEGGAA